MSVVVVAIILAIQKMKPKRLKNNSDKKSKTSGIFDHPSDEVAQKQLWPQSKLQVIFTVRVAVCI